MKNLLEVKNLSKIYKGNSFFGNAKDVKALNDINFTLKPYEILSVIGESGCGKSTLAKLLIKLITPSSGQVIYDTRIIEKLTKDVQIIFQNPYQSLSPRMRIRDLMAEPLFIHHIAKKNSKDINNRLEELLKMVGMEKDALERFPHQFSGGQRQRICIARALACEPKLLILDEPISSLDLTIQVKMLDLFLELKKKLGLTYIFISHNLAVVKKIADSILILKEGELVENNRTSEIFVSPKHPYTKKLIEAAK